MPRNISQKREVWKINSVVELDSIEAGTGRWFVPSTFEIVTPCVVIEGYGDSETWKACLCLIPEDAHTKPVKDRCDLHSALGLLTGAHHKELKELNFSKGLQTLADGGILAPVFSGSNDASNLLKSLAELVESVQQQERETIGLIELDDWIATQNRELDQNLSWKPVILVDCSKVQGSNNWSIIKGWQAQSKLSLILQMVFIGMKGYGKFQINAFRSRMRYLRLPASDKAMGLKVKRTRRGP